jgi:hypothetical protein
LFLNTKKAVSQIQPFFDSYCLLEQPFPILEPKPIEQFPKLKALHSYELDAHGLVLIQFNLIVKVVSMFLSLSNTSGLIALFVSLQSLGQIDLKK